MNDELKDALKYWVEFMDLQEYPPMRMFGNHKYLKFIPFKNKSKLIKAYARYHNCSRKNAETLVKILNDFYIQNKTMMDNKFKNYNISITNTKEFNEYFSRYINLDEIEFIDFFSK